MSFSRFALGFRAGSVNSTGCSAGSTWRLKKMCLAESRLAMGWRYEDHSYYEPYVFRQFLIIINNKKQQNNNRYESIMIKNDQ
jgi:hypothetical protein